MLDAVNVNITVTSTLVNYSYVPPAVSSDSSFTLTVIDPCNSTALLSLPSVTENLVAFAGYTVVSRSKIDFNDTVSLAKTFNTDALDFCGEKLLQVQLNGTNSSFLIANFSEYIYFSPPATSKDFGVSLATVEVSMKDYPWIKSFKLCFTATILGSVVPLVSD